MRNFEEVKNGITFMLDQFFDTFAKGNEGYSEIEELSLVGTTLKFRVLIVHRHANYIREPFSGRRIRIQVYSVTTHIDGKCDLLNPHPDDLRICVNSPVGDICATIADLVPEIGAILEIR